MQQQPPQPFKPSLHPNFQYGQNDEGRGVGCGRGQGHGGGGGCSSSQHSITIKVNTATLVECATIQVGSARIHMKTMNTMQLFPTR